ncbi:MAG: sel1 repeat family protein [Puniceicoccales bacterium]|jgi:TPR repeat protein|nr:sel1 repeat family protein [Puniceicoccales bacterium]
MKTQQLIFSGVVLLFAALPKSVCSAEQATAPLNETKSASESRGKKTTGEDFKRDMLLLTEEKKVEKALLFRRAADLGDAEAQFKTGMCYLEGIGVAQDKTEAFRWLLKAAQQKDDVAQNAVGVCYLKGIGVAQDNTEAVRWLHKAAEQNNADTQLLLGIIYAKGEIVPKDADKAIRWVQAFLDNPKADAEKKKTFSAFLKSYKEHEGKQ